MISLDVRGNLLQDSQFIVKVTKKLIRNILATKKKAQKNDDEENDFIKEIMSEVLIQSNLDSMALATIMSDKIQSLNHFLVKQKRNKRLTRTKIQLLQDYVDENFTTNNS